MCGYDTGRVLANRRNGVRAKLMTLEGKTIVFLVFTAGQNFLN